MNIESLAAVTAGAAVFTLATGTVPPESFDLQGVSFVIGAVGVTAGTLVTSALAIGTYLRAGRAEMRAIEMLAAQAALAAAQTTMAVTQKETHDLVDGISKEAKAAAKRADFAEGEKVGSDKERDKVPMIPAPPPATQ